MERCENCNRKLINEVEAYIGLCSRCEKKQPVPPKDLVEFAHITTANNQEHEGVQS